ncbi:MAG: isochorismatase family protein [Pigmentiphaga sp.]
MRHPFDLLPAVRSRMALRSRPHIFERLDPARTALLVIDMQNNWLQQGYPGYTPYGAAIVPIINGLATVVRESAGLVAWIQMNGSAEVAREWPPFRAFFTTEAQYQAWTEALTPGAPGYDFWHELDQKEGDLQLEKRRYSAFISGSSSLHEQLQEKGIDTVLITGTATNTCCESTARDAHMLGYQVIMVADANAARSDEEHIASLSSLAALFADVRTADEVAGLIREGRSA